jgi:sugar lactone lactonase YvrE
MRLLPAVLLTSVMSWSAFCQTHTISTFAGGGLPVNIPGTSAGLSGGDKPESVAADRAGNLFFVYKNAVLRLDARTGVLTLVAGNGTPGFSGDNGPATSAQLSDPLGVAVDSAGNLYIADWGNDRVRKVSKGVITTVAGNGTHGDNGPATSAQLADPHGVAVDSAGNLYVTDDYGSTFKVSNGAITTVAGNGTLGFSGDNGPATSAQLFDPDGVAVDSAGNLYIADWNNDRVRKVSKGVITTVAGNGLRGFSGDNGPATSAQLNSPHGVAVDSVGNLYIADSNNDRVRKVSKGVITTVAGSGLRLFSGALPPARPRSDKGPATSAQLSDPIGVAVDSAGNLYIADAGKIRKVSKGVITTVAGNGTGFSGDNGPATSAQLSSSGVAVDPAGNLYIADTWNNRIRKVSNGVITTVAGNGTEGSSGDNGPAISAQLSASGVAVDSAGNLYIADEFNNRIRKVSNGVITTVAGNGTRGFSGDNGPATSAQLNRPRGVAADSAGNLYIADTWSDCIRKVSNGVITTVAGNGTGGLGGDDGPATSAQFSLPAGVAVDSAGNLYVADSRRVRKVSNGVITTVAGNGTFGFSGDSGPGFSGDSGPGFSGDNLSATSEGLWGPEGVAVDSLGNVYFADSSGIREVSNGAITTVAGDETFSGHTGPQSWGPAGVAVDSLGNVYFADSLNGRVRVLKPAGWSCSASVSPTALSSGASGGDLTVTVQTASASCAWAVQSLPRWITHSVNAVGTASASVTLSVATNTGASRSATVSIAGVSVTITQ